jgi:hypothetical protein
MGVQSVDLQVYWLQITCMQKQTQKQKSVETSLGAAWGGGKEHTRLESTGSENTPYVSFLEIADNK